MILKVYENGVNCKDIEIKESVSVNEQKEVLLGSEFDKKLSKNKFVSELQSCPSVFLGPSAYYKVGEDEVSDTSLYDKKFISLLKNFVPKIKSYWDEFDERTVSRVSSNWLVFSDGSSLETLSNKHVKLEFFYHKIAGYEFVIQRKYNWDDFDEKYYIRYLPYLLKK